MNIYLSVPKDGHELVHQVRTACRTRKLPTNSSEHSMAEFDWPGQAPLSTGSLASVQPVMPADITRISV